MKKIWDFYENMDEFMYAADIETNEVVYMNRRAREIYGLQSLAEVKGQKCYELLHGSATPCTICNNKVLQVGEFEKWEYYNPLIDKKFLIKDTLVEGDGRYYRVEVAADLTVQEQQQETIKEYIDSERIINEGLKIALSVETPDESIEALLEYVGKALQCDRIYIFEEKPGKIFANTYEWCAQGVVSQKDNLQNIPFEDAKIWMERFRNNENVIIKNLEDTKETDPVMYEYLLPQDIHSLVVSPLFFKNEMIGFYGVDNPPKKLRENIATMFMIMGHFIVSLIRRRNLFNRLQKLSYCDQLTGLGNRYAMDDYIAAMDPEDSLGIVYCDVTGLKKVNDEQGHKQGDKLLLRACEVLKNVFQGNALFRIGGDEFLVLLAKLTEQELLAMIERLKEEMQKYSVIIAIGSIWCPDSKGNMDKLLNKADERMYEDKRKYYEQKAKDRRGRLSNEN